LGLGLEVREKEPHPSSFLKQLDFGVWEMNKVLPSIADAGME